MTKILVFILLSLSVSANARLVDFVCPAEENFGSVQITVDSMYKALKVGSAWARASVTSKRGMGIIDKAHLLSDSTNPLPVYSNPVLDKVHGSYEHGKGIFKIFYFFGAKDETKSDSATECARQIVITKENGLGNGHYEGWLYVDICNPGILEAAKAGKIVPEALASLNSAMKIEPFQKDVVSYVKGSDGKSLFRAKAKITDMFFREDPNACTLDISLHDDVAGFAGISSSYNFTNYYEPSTYSQPVYFWDDKGQRAKTSDHGIELYTNLINQK